MDWQDGMSVGVESIDVHHRQVWRRIRHLEAVVSGGRPDEARRALRYLHVYLSEHSAEEERWMEDAGYPGALEHARSHAEILKRIRAAREGGESLPAGDLLAAADWVAKALERHMAADDLKLGRFWTARENLRRLAENGPGVGALLTPLPGSLAVVVPPARDPDDDEGVEDGRAYAGPSHR